MDEAQRTGVGAALRRTNKGPAGAVIRTVSSADAEAAFNDEAGARGPGSGTQSMPGDHKAGGPGGKGSTAGIRTGSKEAAGGLDVRAAENLRIRQQRQAGAGRAARPATVVPPARTPVQTPSQAPSGPLEDWEVEALAPAPASQTLLETAREAAPEARPGQDGFTPGDQLAVATMDALALLDSLPDGMEVFVGGSGLDPKGVRLVMGLGFLIGKGYAAYRGDSHYRITPNGRAAARRGEASHA